MTDPVTNYCQAILGDNLAAKEAIRFILEFAECSDELLDYIFRYSKPVDLDPGNLLIKQGEFDQWVYFIVRGSLDVIINDTKVGVSKGPIVGERCILGEPRGADLIAGDDSLLALGVEMSIVDEIYREINNFRSQEEDEKLVDEFAEKRLRVVLELLMIVLKDVIKRITDIYQSGISSVSRLEESKEGVTIKVKTLFEFSANEEGEEEGERPEVKSVTLYNFSDFSEVVYYEILQKHMSDFGFLEFSLEEWLEKFVMAPEGGVQVESTLDWMKETYKLPNSELVEVVNSIFEIASQYTTAANRSHNMVLSEFEDEEHRKKALNTSPENDISERQQLAAMIEQELFIPVREALSANSDNTQEASSKMNQADIDALFD